MLPPAQIIAAIRAQPRIPAPSQAISRVLELTRDPECAVSEIAEVISKDPGLTVQLLRQANSALYGCTTPTSSVVQACVRLGIKRIRSAVINQHIVNGLGKVFPKGYDASRFWQSAMSISVAAQNLAQRVAPAIAEDACTAGLLCDLGIGLLAFAIPDDYRPVLEELTRVGFSGIHRAEAAALGLTHADTAAAILLDWKLDAAIIDAVKRHHQDGVDATSGDGENLSFAKLGNIVRCAVILSEIALEGSDMDRVDELFRQMGSLTPDVDALVTDLLDTLVANIQATAQTLSVELGTTDDIESNLAELLRAAVLAEGAQPS